MSPSPEPTPLPVAPPGSIADSAGSSTLLDLLYDELRQLARAKLRHESRGMTLQPTALVHEAYLRLVGDGNAPRWESRAHFFGAAAEAMRRILVDEARRKAGLKRGGDHVRLSLVDVVRVGDDPRDDMLALDEALREFEQVEPRKAKLVELRYFAGLNEAEAAAMLGISRATAARWWAFSKAWLFAKLNAGGSR